MHFFAPSESAENEDDPRIESVASLGSPANLQKQIIANALTDGRLVLTGRLFASFRDSTLFRACLWQAGSNFRLP